MIDYNIDFNFDGVDTMYLTHSLHPYPAKFPPQLPNMILSKFGRAGQVVLDPFCGSGTTLVEARLLGFNAIGVDVNGLSTLLSKVKATPLSNEEILSTKDFISLVENEDFQWSMNRPKIEIKQIEGLEHWFQHNVAEELTHLLNLINKINNVNVRDFLKIVVSSIIVRVSNQESDTRFVAKNKNIPDNFTFRQFLTKAKESLERMSIFSQKAHKECFLKLINADSRNLNMLADESIDIIITSPPYANTYDYYLYHKFRKRWLDIDVKFAQNNEIGSRREYSSLRKPAEQWATDLKLCFEEMFRLVKKGGLAFIVIGDSVIKKRLIKIDEVICEFIPEIGFEVCNVISSSLSEHSRMFNPAFTRKDKKEHLIILKK
jgi:DNA modification methylase